MRITTCLFLRAAVDFSLLIVSEREKHVQTCAVRIAATLLIIDDCIIHQTGSPLVTRSTLRLSTLFFCTKNLYHLKSHLAPQTLCAASGRLLDLIHTV